jgi:hypothetical protein
MKILPRGHGTEAELCSKALSRSIPGHPWPPAAADPGSPDGPCLAEPPGPGGGADAQGKALAPWERKWLAGTVELSAPLKSIDQVLK